MAIIEIFKSCLLRLFVPLIFPQDISNWMIKSVVFNNPYFMLISPRLQLVCLGRGLVGYWKGYFNHKRCRRRRIFKVRRYEFLLYILNPRRTHLLLLNKVFDLLRKCGLCYYSLYCLSYQISSNFTMKTLNGQTVLWVRFSNSEVLRVGNKFCGLYTEKVLTIFFYLYLQAVLDSPDVGDIFLEIKTRFPDSKSKFCKSITSLNSCLS